MRFEARLTLGWLAWVGVSGGVLRFEGVLTVDRLFIAAFVGFLAVATLTLPERPSRWQVSGVVIGTVAGLGVFAFLVYRELQYLLAG